MLVYIGAGLVALGLAVGGRRPRLGLVGTPASRSRSRSSRASSETAAPSSPSSAAGTVSCCRSWPGMQGLASALSPAGTGDRLARMLDRAGNPSPWTRRASSAPRGARSSSASPRPALRRAVADRVLLALVAGALLFFLPDLLLHNLALKRQEETSKGLAEALDMLSVCVQAGQGFDAALMQVARNVDGPISGEFARVLSEIQIGKSRGEAFRRHGRARGAARGQELHECPDAGDRLGLPIGTVLREQTATMRLVRG